MYEAIQNNINWLAQCKRRMKYPVDQSDKAGLTAFEYGWKSFNNLYSEFDVRPDKAKMRKCIEKYIDPRLFVSSYWNDIKRFCDVEHRVYLGDKQYESLTPRLSGCVSRLRENLENGNDAEVMLSLIDCLYVIRNARVHGSFGTGKVYFSFLPKIIYLLNLSILSRKLDISTKKIKEKVDSRLVEIKSGIA